MGVCKMFSFRKSSTNSDIKPSKLLPLVLVFSILLLSACNPSEQSSSKASEAKAETAEVVEESAVAEEETYTTGHFGYGVTATPEQIAGWDIDIKPDGSGLPVGEGSVEDGEELFEEKCASCHGSFGEGVKNWPRLSGGQGSLRDERPDKTVGSYWAYSSTLWDYIRRAMPFPAPQSLENDEVYAITAYILNLNELVDDEFVLNQDNLASIKMANAKENFIPDDRPDTNNTRCMENCKVAKDIIVTHIMGAAADVEEDRDETTSTDDIKVLSENARKGEAIYSATCKACHSIGIAGSPKFGDSREWGIRFSKGKEVLYQGAINGFEGEAGFMPAKGGNLSLTDDEVKAAVDFLLESSL